MVEPGVAHRGLNQQIIEPVKGDMTIHRVNKTYQEINAKIKSGNVVVVTAEEIIDIAAQSFIRGAVVAAIENRPAVTVAP